MVVPGTENETETESSDADGFEAALIEVLARAVPGFARLVSARRLSGGASQETYRIDLEAGGRPSTLAMRRAAGGPEAGPNPDRPGLAVEAELFRVAKAAGVPEPEIVWVLRPSDGLGSGFIMEWLDGETLGSRILRSPELDEVRPRLARECGRVLARIHAIDPVATGLDRSLQIVPTETFVRRMWEEYQAFRTPQPMIDFTARWLLDHLPVDDDARLRDRLVHNDFRNGNLMITAEGVAGVLDWEVAHIGDPVRDLGWICTSSWRFGRADLPVGGFGEREDLLAGYEEVSGVHVDAEHLRFWEVFGSYWWAIGCLKMAEAWRNGPDATVERPGVARRSSECQADCVNLVIPGPVELVDGGDPASSTDMPTAEELVVSVRDFLRNEVRFELEGRSSFMALVASNSLDIVVRELRFTPAHHAGEWARLLDLVADRSPGGEVATGPSLDDLRWRLTTGLRDGTIELDRPGLADHLRTTVMNQLAIDQPKYPALVEALHTGDR